TAAEAKKIQGTSSCGGVEGSVKRDVFRNHARGRKAFGVLEGFRAPPRAFVGICQTQQIGRESSFVFDGMSERGFAGNFDHRFAIDTKDRTAAGVRFGNGPTEALESGREKKRDGAIIESFEGIAVRIRNLDDTIR